MIRILSTDGLATQIRDIIRQAQEIVILISPFIDKDSDIFDYLDKLNQKARPIYIFVITRTPDQVLSSSRKSHITALRKFSQINNCFVHYCPNLHTKCYFNETDMVITSLNMLPTSEENNFELGVHINREDNNRLFGNALLEVNKICEAAYPKMNQIESDGSFTLKRLQAFCIHSGENTDYQGLPDELSSTEKKYIKHKYYKDLSAQQKKEDSPQHYCHLCGREYTEESKIFSAPPTLAQPFCKQCAAFLDAVSLDNFWK